MDVLEINLDPDKSLLISKRLATLVKAIEIIHRDNPSVAELMRTMDVAKGTAHSIVKDLESLGIVQKDLTSRRREPKNQRRLQLSSKQGINLTIKLSPEAAHNT